MRSIARTFAVSLGLATTAIFLATVGIVIWQYHAYGQEPTYCQAAAAILDHAAHIGPGRSLTVRSTRGIEELKSNSPNLWYVVSNDDLMNEYGSQYRPALPFPLPYTGPIGLSVLNTADQKRTFCLVVVPRPSSPLVMLIGDAQVYPGQIVVSFVSRNLFPISLLAIAFASTVIVGATLAARFVARSIERVTRLALAIDPAAPQGFISLDEVPIELKPLINALNRAFGEIDAYIKMQRRFLGNAAHQLRTPLTLLRAKIEDVAEPVLKSELVRDVRRLSSLVSAMLDLARLQSHAIQKRPLDLAIVTRDVLADFGPSALDAGIELSLEQTDDGPFIIQGVEAAIQSALANLVGNALLHARGARRISAHLKRGTVSISDDGMGIRSGPEQKVAEPFQTGNTPKQGAGLGLSIIQEIMAAHGGDLVITSAQDGGTTASLRFPEALAGPDELNSLSVQS
jgi:signal transduction histidine kinase